MKLLLETWNNFLNEQKYSIPHSTVVGSVDRALEILGLSSNTNLRQFLIEIAIMESGGSPKGVSKITHHVSNPFQVTDGALQVTKDTWKLKVMRDRIFKNAKMSNPWAEQSSSEVKGNVTMGALTAAMWILHKTNPSKNAPKKERPYGNPYITLGLTPTEHQKYTLERIVYSSFAFTTK